MRVLNLQLWTRLWRLWIVPSFSGEREVDDKALGGVPCEMATWPHEQSRNTSLHSYRNTSPPHINRPESCSRTTTMVPNLAESQHTQIRDMIISKFANATITRTVTAGVRA
jgi:hypothetical protein